MAHRSCQQLLQQPTCVLVSSVPWKQQCFPWEELHIQLAYLCQRAVFGSTAQVLPGDLSVADKACGRPSAPLSPPNGLAACTHRVPACLVPATGLFAGWDLSSLKPPLSFLPVRAELCWNVVQVSIIPMHLPVGYSICTDRLRLLALS